jgi:cell wall-associated NlpC family hydrolase
MKYIFLIIALGGLLQYRFRSDDFQASEKVQIQAVSSTDPQPAVSDESPSNDVPSNPNKATKLVEYAKLFYGVPYQYGSCDPEVGFDCSGFINHVFTHFDIDVPRSSVNFTNIGTTVEVEKAAPGDLILFTGTNPHSRTVGHIGIVVRNDDEGLDFIHSSSGKQYSVTISPLEGYYEKRFVKVIRMV